MMTAETIRAITPEAYWAQEQTAEIKSEYFQGEILAMAGGSPQHNQIPANIIVVLGTQLWEKSCRIFGSDQRVQASSDVYVYPDLTIVCGEPVFQREQPDVLVNPTVIVEVTSPSSQHHDHIRKWLHYQKMPSLTDYLMVAQESVQVEHFQRSVGGAWSYHLYEQLSEVIMLETNGATISLAQIYHRLFPAP